MTSLLYLIPLLTLVTLIPAINGACIMLAARLLRHKGITWKQGFVLGLIAVMCSILMRKAAHGFGHPLSLVPNLVLGFLANVLIGGWFFRRRGADAAGRQLGWTGAMQLSGLASIMLGLTGAIFIGVLKMFLVGTGA